MADLSTREAQAAHYKAVRARLGGAPCRPVMVGGAVFGGGRVFTQVGVARKIHTPSPLLMSIIETTARVSGCSVAEITGRSLGGDLRRVRSFIFYQAVRAGMSASSVGRMMHRHVSTVTSGFEKTGERIAAGQIPSLWLAEFKDMEDSE